MLYGHKISQIIWMKKISYSFRLFMHIIFVIPCLPYPFILITCVGSGEGVSACRRISWSSDIYNYTGQPQLST